MRDRKVYHHQFINNVFGSFFRGLGDWFRNELFNRTTEIVISTFEKAVQYQKKQIEYGGETHSISYPFLSLDPMIDMEPDQIGGIFLHGYQRFSSGQAADMYDPILYDDNNIRISPVLNRYRGNIEIIVWCSSIYELIDNRIKTFQYFGGLNRPMDIYGIEGYITLPDELISYSYNNPYIKEDYKLDWNNCKGVDVSLIKNINQNKYIFPYSMKPQIKLTSVSDASEKYGGGDDLSEYKMSIEIEWEIPLPTHLVLEANKEPNHFRETFCELQVGAYHKMVGPLGHNHKIAGEKLMMFKDGTNSVSVDLVFGEQYNYIITQEDETTIQNNINININVPVTLNLRSHVQVLGPFGELREGYHYRLEDNNIILLGEFIEGVWKEDVFTIVIYIEE